MRRIASQCHSATVVVPWHCNPVLDLVVKSRCAISACGSERFSESLGCFVYVGKAACVV